MINLSTAQLDALKELGSMGAAHAVSGLSMLLNARIEMAVPKVQLVEIQNVADILGGPEKIVSAVYLELKGDINGAVVMIIPKDNAVSLVDIVLHNQKQELSGDNFNAYEESMLKEFANISICAYLGILAQMTSYHISCSVPYLAMDMLGGILEQVLAIVAIDINQVLLIETDFNLDTNSASGIFLLLPDSHSLQKMLHKLSV